MRVFEDYEGQKIFLTDSAERHIVVGHPEMLLIGMYDSVRETLSAPEIVIYQASAFHYFRMRYIPPYENNYVRVVVEVENGDRHVRTAHVVGRLLPGDVIWQQEN